jgi:hypothetical protein
MNLPSPYLRYYIEVGEYIRSITDVSLTIVLSLAQKSQGDNYKWRSKRISDHSNIHQDHRRTIQSLACGMKNNSSKHSREADLVNERCDILKVHGRDEEIVD